MTKRRFIRGLVYTSLLAAALSIANKSFTYFPELQRIKRDALPFLNLNATYDIPNVREKEQITQQSRLEVTDSRQDLEDKISELFIITRKNFAKPIPGGILLNKNDTRRGQLFGRFDSYDPTKTQKSVESISNRSSETGKRILIYDEGEGGYVLRIGTLPSAEDIGNYLTNNVLGKTLSHILTPEPQIDKRRKTVQRLLDNHARDLALQGIDVVFSPVLDVSSELSEDNLIRKNKRSFSSSYPTVLDIATMYIDALHNNGIKTCGKHFLNAGLPEGGDVHMSEVDYSKRISPKLRSGNLYRKLASVLDAVIVTHIRNPSDSRPFTLSNRAIEYLTNPKYNNGRFKGLDFDGLVISDDLSMKGLTSFVETAKLTPRDRYLTQDCTTVEAKAAVLALDAGVHSMILCTAQLSPIINGIKSAYYNDTIFAGKVDKAIEKYRRFAEK